MKSFLIALILFFSITKLQAQETPVIDTIIVGGIVFEKVELVINVKLETWRNRLEKILVPIIKKARKKMKAGTYTVNVRLLIEKDGSINAVKALNDPGYGIAEAAENVVKVHMGWRPVEAGTNKVRSYHTQSITFQIRKK